MLKYQRVPHPSLSSDKPEDLKYGKHGVEAFQDGTPFVVISWKEFETGCTSPSTNGLENTGWLEHVLYFHSVGNFIISMDELIFHIVGNVIIPIDELIFSRGVGRNHHQPEQFSCFWFEAFDESARSSKQNVPKMLRLFTSTNQGGLPYIPPKVKTILCISICERRSPSWTFQKKTKTSKTADEDTGMGQTYGE